MAIPRHKSEAIENLLNQLAPNPRRESIIGNTCSWCGKPAEEFKDALSQKEYTISGFCQVCQDKTFGE